MTEDSDERATEPVEGATTAVPSSNYKTRGELDEPGAGVVGHNTATSGETRGVEGVVDSATDGATGVRGEATATSGTTYGVVGVSRSSDVGAAIAADAPNGAAGVLSVAPEGDSFVGFTDEGDGVNAKTRNGAATGVQGTNDGGQVNPSGDGNGVSGRLLFAGDGASGVRGEAAWGSGLTYGVHGTTDSVDADATGVLGEATAGSGQTYGVRGTTASAAGYGLATPDDASVGGDLDLGGAVNADTLTVAAFSGGTFTVPDSTETTLAFDATAIDEPGAWDPSNGRYTCPADGNYQVTANLKFATAFAATTTVTVSLYVDGSLAYEWNHGVAAGLPYERSITHTLAGLSAGAELSVRVTQDSGNDKEMPAGETGSLLEVRALGDRLT